MKTLNERLLSEVTKLEQSFKIILSEKQKYDLIKGISIGGSPVNTFDRALSTLTERFKNLSITLTLIA